MDIEPILKPILRASVHAFRRGVEEATRIRRRAKADTESLLVSSQPGEELRKIARQMAASALLGISSTLSDGVETLWEEKHKIKRYLSEKAGEFPQPKEEEFNVNDAALLLGRPNDVSGARTRLLAAFETQPDQARSISKGLCLKDAWAPGWLDENRIRVLGTVIACALRLLGESSVPSDPESISGLLPEVAVFLESFSAILKLSGTTSVAVVIPMFGEQAYLHEYIHEHVIQLEALRALNPSFNWSLSLVCDGDDRISAEGARRFSSAEVAAEVIQDGFFDDVRDRISVLQFPQEEKERIGSKKGGAVIYGMRNCIEKGASYIITNDIDFAMPLLTIGTHLLHLSDDTDVTIASRWHQGAVGKRPMVRWGISAAFVFLRSSLYPELGNVIDTQVAVKGFKAEALGRILPFSSDGRWEDTFEYGLSFDVQLLARASMRGLVVKEIGSILYWSQTWGAIPPTSGIEMGSSLFIQRSLLDDELAREAGAMALIAGGYNFQVYTRSDVDVVVKIPKMSSGIGKLYHKSLSQFLEVVSPQTDTKRLWTHGLMGLPLMAQLRQRIPAIPPLLKSILFDLYRLASPGSDPLEGYRIAGDRLGGLSLAFEIVTNVSFRAAKYGNLEDVFADEAVVQQKVDPRNSIGNLIIERSIGDCRQGKQLIDQAIELQEKLWRRGVFDRDVTNVLQNSVLVNAKEVRLLDPDDLTDDLDEAFAIVESEKSQLAERIDVQLLLCLRRELGEYYLNTMRRIFTPQHIRDVWATEELKPVHPPSGIHPFCEMTCQIDRLYEQLISLRADHSSPVLVGGDHENR